MNASVGKTGSAVTGISVLLFALTMLFADGIFASCLASMFIAMGFIPFMCAIFALSRRDDKKGLGFTGIAFSVVYAVIILLVYYSECTTVRLNASLSNEALFIISFGHTGSLFFNYDLLGYAIMSLSTFIMAFLVEPECKSDRIFKWLLLIHGIFFLPCLVIPMFPVFTPDTAGYVGTVVLEIWCLYFLPVCVLGYRYFSRKAEK